LTQMPKQTPTTADFRVRFWGVRGSHPTSKPDNLRFGGHTSCVEIIARGERLIFDAGTGIIPLGERLMQDGQCGRMQLFLSHTHHDHLLGFYFFQPLFRRDCRVLIFGPGFDGKSLKGTLQTLMQPRFFPVRLHSLTARTSIHSLNGGECIRVSGSETRLIRDNGRASRSGPGVTIQVHKSAAHPYGVLLYRITNGEKSIVYATDVEQQRNGDADAIGFFRGADLLIHDAQYTEAEYQSRSSPRRGWGHTTVERATRAARAAGVKQLILFHHDPDHDDRTLERMERAAQRLWPATHMAYEGLEIEI
jgi:ribonuclease BN (tRNA processing enzyme)